MSGVILPLQDAVPAGTPRLLDGPARQAAETLDEHQQRLGPRPRGGTWLHDPIRAAGLRGRGGSWFPTWIKWQEAASSGRATVLVINASEGEPLSGKDKHLLLRRPHLVLDGAMLLAETIGAQKVIFYISRPSQRLQRGLRHALKERRHSRHPDAPVDFCVTAHRYVAGESSAVIRRINGGPSKPEFAATRADKSLLFGLPAVVQNVETVANVALIARYGAEWFRRRGTTDAPGTMLTSVVGDVGIAGVYEVDVGTTLSNVIENAGGYTDAPGAFLLGGYFGSWHRDDDIRLDPATVTLGCGVIGVVGVHGCPLVESARIVNYLARESARQCGPCIYGLPAIATMMSAVARGVAGRDDVLRAQRWSRQIAGRGACHHPDGAVSNALSALTVFADDVERHLMGFECRVGNGAGLPAPSRPGWRWR